tara:strand:+ start:111 stop:296 length:186 start_codon:yes stop_codon:yes gene_type:complete
MQRIIRVVYNPQIAEGEITIQRHRDYYTNTDTLDEAIESARTEILKTITIIGGEIVSIEQI